MARTLPLETRKASATDAFSPNHDAIPPIAYGSNTRRIVARPDDRPSRLQRFARARAGRRP
jgi:hypothetical protein